MPFTGKPKVRLICPSCNIVFYRHNSQVELNKKRGDTNCCSRKCADEHKKYAWKKFGKDTSNFKDGNSSYRQIAIRNKGLVCEKCGYDGTKYPKLIWVHHKDFTKRGNYNNNIFNLSILCIRCHLEEHYAISK